MSTSAMYSPLVSKIYRSRIIILDILKSRGFNVDDYINFSVNEVHIMYSNKQLDMLLTNPTTNRKIYVKYHLATKLRHNILYELIDDLFDIEETLSNKDELIIVTKERLNETQTTLIDDVYKRYNKYVNVFDLHDYLFNILEQSLVPTHKPLNEEETAKVTKKYNISHPSQWPEISRFDPVARTLGLRPGQLCEITRNSPTAITSTYYRLCQ